MTYMLNYCGDNGDYCETLYDQNIKSVTEHCSYDPNFENSMYLGFYEYF